MYLQFYFLKSRALNALLLKFKSDLDKIDGIIRFKFHHDSDVHVTST